jgi:F-type H+-transporting ATPase subunit delta
MSKNDSSVHNSPAAVAYARSLLELANERGQAKEVGEEMKAVGQILAENPGFKEFLSNPSVGATERSNTFDKLFKGQASELVYSMIRVANEKGRAGILDEIAAEYTKLLDVQLGNVDVDVTSATELEPDQRETINQRVNGMLGKNANLHHHVDASIIGGLVVRIGDKVLDASVKSQLKSLRERMLASHA